MASRTRLLMSLMLVVVGCSPGEANDMDSGWVADSDSESDGEEDTNSSTDTDEVRTDYWSLAGQVLVEQQSLIVDASTLELSTWSSEDLDEPTCTEQVRLRKATEQAAPEGVWAWWELTLGSTIDEGPEDTGDTAPPDDTADSGDSARSTPPDSSDTSETGDTGMPVRSPCPSVDFERVTVGMGALDTQLLPAMNAAELDEGLPVHGLYLLPEGGDQVFVFGIAGTSAQLAGEGDAPTGPPIEDGTYLWLPLYLFPI